ncbi:hypothetical protein ES703_108040 [subsurface metagenome]
MHEENFETIQIDTSTGEWNPQEINNIFSKMGKHVNFWFVRPHFHLICYGWVDEEAVKTINKRTGWVVKNLGVRDSVYTTALYQLSHCGVKKGIQSVTWFGKMSNKYYCKLNPAPKLKPKKATCPHCECKLIPLVYRPGLALMLTGKPPPLLGKIEGGYLVNPEGWRGLLPSEKLHTTFIKRPAKGECIER